MKYPSEPGCRLAREEGVHHQDVLGATAQRVYRGSGLRLTSIYRLEPVAEIREARAFEEWAAAWLRRRNCKCCVLYRAHLSILASLGTTERSEIRPVFPGKTRGVFGSW